MAKIKSDPRIDAAPKKRLWLLQKLEEISPNGEWIDTEPGLPGRLAETFRAVARVAHEAAEALEADEEGERCSLNRQNAARITYSDNTEDLACFNGNRLRKA